MNEILKLKNNFSSPSQARICQLINQHVSSTDSSIQEYEQRLAVDRQKIDNFSSEFSILKDKYDAEQRNLDAKMRELDAEKQKVKALETERDKIIKLNFSLERNYDNLSTKKPNATDQHILDLGMKKFELYKQLTRIRWDYMALEEAKKGFVSDKKKYLRTFCFPNNITSTELCDLLWKEIERSTTKFNKDDHEDKENVSNT